jgi:hypothetical protein
VVEGDLGDTEGTEAVGFSHGDQATLAGVYAKEALGQQWPDLDRRSPSIIAGSLGISGLVVVVPV